MNVSRRLALALGGGMGLAAVAGEWAKPVADLGAMGAVPLDRIFPHAFGGWKVDPAAERLVKPQARETRVHGIYDQVLERTYVDTDGARVMLLAAQGSEQSSGLQVHRPEICYPGNGFRVDGLSRAIVQAAGRRVPITRLHARMPGRSEPITYWVVLGGEVMSDNQAFWRRQMQFGFQRRLLDGMVVRLSSIEPEAGGAYVRHARFMAEMADSLAPDALRRVLGSPAQSRD